MKKLNQKGFTHHLLIFAILALVVGAAGFAGWRIYKNKNIDAQAYNWTRIAYIPFGSGNRSAVSVFACKSAVSNSWFKSINGRIIRAYVVNTTSYDLKWGVHFNGTSLSNTYLIYDNISAYKTSSILSKTATTRSTDDYVAGIIGASSSKPVKVSNLASC